MIGRDGTCARPPAWLHTDPPELAADGAGAAGTLSRARPGPPWPRPGGAPHAELRRLRGLRPRPLSGSDAHPRRLLDGWADRPAYGADARARDRHAAGSGGSEPGA